MVDLRYRVYGSGERTLLLIHGWACSLRYWDELVARLPGGYRAVAVDLRGCGDSPKPSQGYAYTDYVADFAALIERLQLPPLAVVGHSMGGSIALRLALDHPQLLRALVIVDSGANVAQRECLLAELGDELLVNGLSPPRLEAAVATWFLAPRVDQVRKYLAIALASPGTIRACSLAQHMASDLRSEIPGIRLPVLVLHGEHDRTRALAEAEFLRDAIPGSELRVIGGAAHVPQVEQPDATLAAMRDFFARRVNWGSPG